MLKGDLILLPFPFTDLKGEKLRPALVLYANNLDVTVAFITSEIKWITPNDLKIEPTKLNGLKTASLIRLSKIATLDKELVLGKMGNLPSDSIEKVNRKLKEIFQLN